MLILLFITAILYHLAIGVLFIHFTYKRHARSYSAKVIAIRKKESSNSPRSTSTRNIHYSPVIEYQHKLNQNIIFIAGGAGTPQYLIGQKVEVLVLHDQKENVILKDNLYLTFGGVFSFATLFAFSIYAFNNPKDPLWWIASVIFLIIPCLAGVMINKKLKGGLASALVKNTNIVTREQLKNFDIIWDNSELERIEKKNNFYGAIICYILLAISFTLLFFAFKDTTPSQINAIEGFIKLEVPWDELGRQSRRKVIFGIAGLYMVATALISLLRLKKKKRKISLLNS